MNKISSEEIRIRNSYRIRRIMQYVLVVPLLSGAILIAHSGVIKSDPRPVNIAMLIGGIALSTVVLIFNFFVWRCPSCKTYLHRNTGKHCHECKVKLK
jgi:hypothetical protein